MATTCYLNFPAIEIKTATDSILYAVAKYVSGKFPQRVIKQTFVDIQDKMRDIYKNAVQTYSGKLSENNKYQEMLKVPRPHMFVGYTFDSSFDTTETGLGETQHYMMPNAFWFQESMQSSLPVLKDTDRNITIATNNIRIRVTAEFAITCANREEQFTIYTYILNTLKIYYTMVLQNIQASYIVPDYVITFMKDALYGENTPIENCFDDFSKYMKKYSKDGIYPVFKNNKKEDSYFEMKYDYRHVDFRLTSKPQMDEGQKAGEAPDNFLVRFPAELQFYVPINYTIKCPELIPNGAGGTFEVPSAIKLDSISNDNLQDHIQTVIKRYEDTAIREPRLYDKGFSFILRREFTIMNPEDYFNLKDLMTDSLLTIFNYLTDKQRKECFKFYIYEDRHILDPDIYYTMDDDWNIFIHKGDTTKVHEIEIYIDDAKIDKIIKFRELQDRRNNKTEKSDGISKQKRNRRIKASAI